jgi:hypothetical protein
MAPTSTSKGQEMFIGRVWAEKTLSGIDQTKIQLPLSMSTMPENYRNCERDHLHVVKVFENE